MSTDASAIARGVHTGSDFIIDLLEILVLDEELHTSPVSALVMAVADDKLDGLGLP
jgi:hypothetical protein